ncbi:MAG: ADP-ribosylglycohydrolase family protein [Burkholderiales bacterium]|nr:ADP-ribosylglycohydrolase family protein [Burkholderiales bacterium]
MLIEIAIGDAYGAGFEFAPRAKIDRHNDGAGYVGHELGIPAGRYTDDTQMSIAIAELLLRDALPDALACANAFVEVYRRDPRAGYSKGFGQLLGEVADGADLLRRIHPGSVRNGAAMRSVPLGLIADRRVLRRVAREQAAVTHDSPEGRLSSEVVALMSHALIHRAATIDQLAALVAAETGFALRVDWSAEVAVDAIETLHAVHTALARHRSMRELLRACVAFGGDTDSVAAIALGLASLSPEFSDDLPPSLRGGLENGPYGHDWLLALDARLVARFAPTRGDA